MALSYNEGTNKVGSSTPIPPPRCSFLLLARASSYGFPRRPLHVSGDALRTKSGSGTVSMNVSSWGFVEAERYLTQRQRSISLSSPQRRLQNFKWDTSASLFHTYLRCSATNVAISIPNCEHCLPLHTYNVSPASKTKTSNTNDSLDATTSVTYMTLSGPASSLGEMKGPDPYRTLPVAEFFYSQDGVASKGRPDTTIRTRPNLHATPRERSEVSDQRGEFVFDGVGLLAPVNEQRRN